jgi:L-histidine N-alpha-methyltransferase
MKIATAQTGNGSVTSLGERLEFEQLYVDPGAGKFLEDVLEGLGRRPASIPYYYFYDERGSQLFEQITELPEYYLTACEREILAMFSLDILEHAGAPTEIVEFGSGSAEKTRHLLAAALKLHANVCFVPIDISGEALKRAAKGLIADFPRLNVYALAAEYRQGLQAGKRDGPPRLFLFMGSSMGNMSDEEAVGFLQDIREVCRPFDRVLIGVDLAKDGSIIEPAYNDSQGITAAFNRNVLRRINRELGGDFDLSKWKHEAPYLEEEGHVEMRLTSLTKQTVRVGGKAFEFDQGEAIWTERCRKYTEARLGQIVRQGGFETVERWYDSRGWFTVRLLQPLGKAVVGEFL